MKKSILTSFACLAIVAVTACLPEGLNAQGISGNPDQWYRDSWRKLFFDFHTYEAAGNVTKNLDADEWARQLEQAHVQTVSLHALCMRGWLYYRKGEHGYIHPKLPEDTDMVGDILDACKKRGITTIAYFNVTGGEPVRRDHPEWLLTKENGEKRHKVSLFSPYLEEMLLPILEEFAGNYDVNGLFFDFLYVNDPDDRHAKRKFCKDTGHEYPLSEDHPMWETYIGWLLKEGKRIRRDAINAVHRGNPDILVAINWSYTYRQPELPPEDLGFLSLDILPYDQVDEASFIAKNWVTLDKPFDIMNTAFLSWWGGWGVKPAEAMMQECGAIMANGGRTFPGYQIRPEFGVEPALMDQYKKTFEFVMAREELCEGANPVPYIAVLNSPAGHFTHGPDLYVPDESLRGAFNMLLQSGFHFNILDEKTLLKNMDRYKAVILPDQRYLGTELENALRGFVRDGGTLVAVSLTGSQDEDFKPAGEFGLEDVFGAKPVGKYGFDHSHIVIKEEKLKKDVLDMPQQTYGDCALLEATSAEVLADLREPLLMEDGNYVHRSSPPGKYTGHPAITLNRYGQGHAVFLGNDIFEAVMEYPQWNLTNMFRNLLNMTISEKLVEVNAPSVVEVVLTEKDGSRQVHLVNHFREKSARGTNKISEHVLPVYNIGVRVKTDKKPGSVTLMPGNQPLDFEYDGGTTGFTVPYLHIHSIAVIE